MLFTRALAFTEGGDTVLYGVIRFLFLKIKIASFAYLTKYSYLLFYFKNIFDFAAKLGDFIAYKP